MTRPPHCLNCARLSRALQKIQVDLENAEIDLRVARAKRKEAEAKLVERQRERPERALAQGVFDYWNLVCRNGAAREFSGKRMENVLARLKHYHVCYILAGIEGAAADPFIDAKGKVFDDLELICRSPEKLDSFIDRQEIERRRLVACEQWTYPAWVMRHVRAGEDPHPRWQAIADKSCEVILMDPRPTEQEQVCPQSSPASTSTRASVA